MLLAEVVAGGEGGAERGVLAEEVWSVAIGFYTGGEGGDEIIGTEADIGGWAAGEGFDGGGYFAGLRAILSNIIRIDEANAAAF